MVNSENENIKNITKSEMKIQPKNEYMMKNIPENDEIQYNW